MRQNKTNTKFYPVYCRTHKRLPLLGPLFVTSTPTRLDTTVFRRVPRPSGPVPDRDAPPLHVAPGVTPPVPGPMSPAPWAPVPSPSSGSEGSLVGVERSLVLSRSDHESPSHSGLDHVQLLSLFRGHSRSSTHPLVLPPRTPTDHRTTPDDLTETPTKTLKMVTTGQHINVCLYLLLF